MVLSLLVLIAVWLALARSADLTQLVLGVLIAGGIVLLQRRLFPVLNPLFSSLLRRPHRLVVFLGILLWRFVASTIYTSRLILFGRDEGQIVAVPVQLDHPIGQFVLLNAITLTPSTISLLLEEDLLYIHWLRKKGRGGDWRKIKESLEARLCAVFERKTDAHR